MSDSRHASTVAHEAAPTGIEEQQQLAGLVHAFIAMMQAGNIARMDLQYRDLRLSLRAHGSGNGAMPAIVPDTRVAAMPPAPATAQSASQDQHHVVTAPMIGTFYVAPAPNEPPFVQPGDHVEEGETIGIIEAMKIMNEIAADRAGTVVEVLAANAQPVEYGSPLVKLQPDPA